MLGRPLTRGGVIFVRSPRDRLALACLALVGPAPQLFAVLRLGRFRVLFPFNDEGQGFRIPSGLLATRYEGLLEDDGVRDVERALSRGTRRRVADRAPGVRTLFTMFAA